MELVEPALGRGLRGRAAIVCGARLRPLVIGVGFIFSRDADTVARDDPRVRFALVSITPRLGTTEAVALECHRPRISRARRSVSGGGGRRPHQSNPALSSVEYACSRLCFTQVREWLSGWYRKGIGRENACCTSRTQARRPESVSRPSQGKAIALAQIGLGADVLFHASGFHGPRCFRSGAQRSSVGDWKLLMPISTDEAPTAVLTSGPSSAETSRCF